MRDKSYQISKELVDKVFSEPNIDIFDYEPPIQVYMGEMRLAWENNIVTAVQNQGITVDKEELIKALRYDRDQYNKGYINGYKKALGIPIDGERRTNND